MIIEWGCLIKDNACGDMPLVNRKGAGMSGDRTEVTALEEKISYPGTVFVVKTKAGTYRERTVVIGTRFLFRTNTC